MASGGCLLVVLLRHVLSHVNMYFATLHTRDVMAVATTVVKATHVVAT